MSGRGCYGNPAPLPPGRSSGWFKIAAAAGIGAAVWFWVLPSIGFGHKDKSQHAPPSHEPPPAPPLHPFDQIAQARGFSSAAEYEDALVATARELEASGAKVELGPHLAHLEPRLRETP